jgi:hypothetical protein
MYIGTCNNILHLLSYHNFLQAEDMDASGQGLLRNKKDIIYCYPFRHYTVRPLALDCRVGHDYRGTSAKMSGRGTRTPGVGERNRMQHRAIRYRLRCNFTVSRFDTCFVSRLIWLPVSRRARCLQYSLQSADHSKHTSSSTAISNHPTHSLRQLYHEIHLQPGQSLSRPKSRHVGDDAPYLHVDPTLMSRL